MRVCSNCKYAEPMNNAIGCMAQKGMPCVEPDDSCERWATTKQTFADCIRKMSDKELAEYLNQVETDGRCGIIRGRNGWREHLKQET